MEYIRLSNKNNPLPEKYSKALELIKEGKLSYQQIAHACKINETAFYRLTEGTYTDGPHIQEKFTNALNEINKQRDKDIRDSIKKCKKKTFRLIDSYLSNFTVVTPKDEKLMSTIVSVANALAKSTPNVEIGSFTYQKGLSPEDIYAEFKRLTGLASDRGAVSSSSAGGTGEVPMAPRPRTPAEEESEDPLL